MPDVKLTEAYIKNLDSAVEFADKKSNEIYYNDTEQRGLTLILNRGGRKAYFFRFNGKKQIMLYFTSHNPSAQGGTGKRCAFSSAGPEIRSEPLTQ